MGVQGGGCNKMEWYAKIKTTATQSVFYMASFWRETNTNAPNHVMKLKGELVFWRTTLNMIFNVTYYMDLHNVISFFY